MTTTTDPPSIFTSLRYDSLLLTTSHNTPFSLNNQPCPYYLLSFHHDRLISAAAHFYPTSTLSCLSAASLLSHLNDTITTHLTAHPNTPLKLRLSLNPSTLLLTTTCAPVPLVSISTLFPSSLPAPSPTPWKLHIDTHPTEPSDFTRFKTDRRAHYDAARARVGIVGYGTEEVVLWNAEGEVMEGSLTGLVFWREGWVMPRGEAGGLAGVVRRWLVREGLVREGEIKKAEVEKGEWVLMCNGVRGVWGGYIE